MICDIITFYITVIILNINKAINQYDATLLQWYLKHIQQ